MGYKKFQLKDVCSYSSERIKVDTINISNYISTENLLPDKKGRVTASSLPKAKTVVKYVEGDTLISNIRPYFRKIWYSNTVGGASADVLVFRPDVKIVDTKYLYYHLSQDEIFDYMVQTSKGTKMPRGDKSALMNYEIKLPHIERQLNVADLLSKLDEKIAINEMIVANFEKLAQTLFKRWFVDFEFPNENGKPYKSSGGEMVESEFGMIPIGWEVRILKDWPVKVSDHVANGSFAALKKNVTILENPSYALFLRNVDLKSNLQNSIRYVDKKTYDFLNKSRLFGSEVIISNVADVGTVHRCPNIGKPMVLGNNQIFINSDEYPKELNTFFYLYFRSKIGQYQISTITSGSAQMKFNKTDFRNLKITLPKIENLSHIDFGQLEEYLLMIESLVFENQKISNLRDTLLPKLLSGEIELPDETEVTEDVPIPRR